MSCLWPSLVMLKICVWVVFAMYTSIALTHDVVSTAAQMSSQSSEGLSEVSHLLLSSLDSPAVSHTEHMLSCWFKTSCHQVMLSVCSQGQVYMSSLTHTLNHFVEDLSTRLLLSCTMQWKPLVTKYHCPELRKAWGYLPGSLHCVIMKLTWLTVTQNIAEVAQEAISICVARKPIHQASR